MRTALAKGEPGRAERTEEERNLVTVPVHFNVIIIIRIVRGALLEFGMAIQPDAAFASRTESLGASPCGERQPVIVQRDASKEF